MPKRFRARKTERCRYFEWDGRPQGGIGCFKSTAECRWIHPDEPEWERAGREKSRSWSPGGDDRGWGTRRARSPQRERPAYGRDRPRRSRSRSRSRGRRRPPTPPKRRHDSIASSSRSTPTITGVRPAPTGPAALRRAQSPVDVKPNIKDLEGKLQADRDRAIDRKPALLLAVAKAKLRQQEPSSSSSILPPTPTLPSTQYPFPPQPPSPGLNAKPSSISISMGSVATPQTPTYQPPPTPIVDVPWQPPPPLPGAPEFEDYEPEVSGVWESRIASLAKVIEEFQEVEDIRESINHISTFVEHIDTLSQDVRTSYAQKLKAAQARLGEKEKTLNATIDVLVKGADMWPVSEKQVERDVQLKERYDEMSGFLDALKTNIAELSSALCQVGIEPPPQVPADVLVRAQDAPVPPPPASSGVAEGDSDAMEVDRTGATPPPPPPAVSLQVSNEPVAQQTISSESELSEAQIDEILTKIEAVETRLEDVENSMSQMDSEMRRDFQEQANAMVEEFFGEDGAFNEAEEQQEQVQEEGETDEGMKKKSNKFDEDLDEVQAKLELLKTESATNTKNLGDVTFWTEQIYDEVVDLKERTEAGLSRQEAALKRNGELSARLEALLKQQAEDTEAIRTIQMSLRAQMQRPPSPPASPRLPSTEVLIQVMRDPLTTAARRAVQPMVEEVRNSMQEEMQKQTGEILGTVWDKVGGTIALLDRVNAKIAQAGNEGVNGH
ncbi:hypothetical protein DFP72DRAFT_873226 [Ephemerocybe angulata]|uniref:C3H1-type domain-containing protein n=1 Tax=Ephemerocybe angulata TaxID=980116 RepID=A0A8H6IGF9_9AGAR|nr:hypothetical protein DFP72DRAFT_873226 [Tulosesus angulatus]